VSKQHLSKYALTSHNRMDILISMVRTRTFDPSSALTSAVELFASKGYAETSMEDIEQALERFADGMGRQSFLRLLEPDASLDHIRKIFDERVSDMCCLEEHKGCLFIHTAMELAPQDDEIRGVLQKFMKRMSKAFSIGLESAKERGEIRADVDVRAAGELLTSTMFGLAVLGRTGFDPATLNGIVDNTLASLSG